MTAMTPISRTPAIPAAPVMPVMPVMPAAPTPDGAWPAALWASSFVLAGLLVARLAPTAAEALAQPGDRGGTASAAGTISAAGSLQMMTLDAGNDDVVLILDGREEELFVYHNDPREGVQLMKRYPLAQLFAEGRAPSGK